MNIFLIGMMGSGKTSIGKTLSSKLDYDFVDTDQLIEKKHNLSVKEIINQFGWVHFRAIESIVLQHLTFNQSTIIATGGGIILNEDNVKFMRKNGIIIYIKVSIEELMNRLNQQEINKRPLLNECSLKDIFDTRKTLYDKVCDIEISCDGLSIESICDRIIIKTID